MKKCITNNSDCESMGGCMKQTLTQRIEKTPIPGKIKPYDKVDGYLYNTLIDVLTEQQSQIDSLENNFYAFCTFMGKKDNQPSTAMRSTGDVSIKNGDITPEGYMVVFISDYFFDYLAKELNKIARHHGEPETPMFALRDEPGMIEFHRMKK